MTRLHNWFHRTFALVFLATALLAPLLLAQPTHAQQRERCFSETGYCVRGLILDYWERNGGLAVFGFPVSDLAIETNGDGWTGPTQWFERDRLEDHSAEGLGVLAGRLGVELLERQGRSWWDFERTTAEQTPADCRFFPETNHSLCAPFLSYWQNNGGLERFGYPISQQFTEQTPNGWNGTVQYFERRRMEYHPEHAGTEFAVLLGLLGNEIRGVQGGAPCPAGLLPELCASFKRVEFADAMGTPTQIYGDVLTAVQNFEYGLMIWTRLTEEDKRIYAILSYNAQRQYRDTWTEEDGEYPNVTPPEGLHRPRRGFGKVWINNPDLRNMIGWAIEETERATTSTMQLFDNGSALIWVHGTDMVYAIGPNEWLMASFPYVEE